MRRDVADVADEGDPFARQRLKLAVLHARRVDEVRAGLDRLPGATHGVGLADVRLVPRDARADQDVGRALAHLIEHDAQLIHVLVVLRPGHNDVDAASSQARAASKSKAVVSASFRCPFDSMSCLMVIFATG